MTDLARRRGLALSLSSTLCFALSATLVRTAHCDPQLGVFVRGLVTVALVAPFVGREVTAILRGGWWLLLRVLGGAGSILAAYWTLGASNVGTSRALANLAPLLVLVVEVARGAERVSPRKAAGFLCAVAGLALLLGQASVLPAFVVAIGLLGASSASLAFVSLGEAATRMRPETVVVAHALGLALTSLVGADESWLSPPMVGLACLVLAGVCAAGGQVLMTRAFGSIEASTATQLGLLGLPLGVGLDLAVNGERPSTHELGAYALILVGVALVPARARATAGASSTNEHPSS